MNTVLAQDFTIEQYSQILQQIKTAYKFVNYSDCIHSVDNSNLDNVIIWRHDVDVSVHNALRLAQIEYKMGIKATYFFLLNSWFYDIRDPLIHSLLVKIKKLDHNIGLHFDFSYIPGGLINNQADFTKSLEYQKKELENIADCTIDVFSMHNPTVIQPIFLAELNHAITHCDMINVYHDFFIKKFKYCSDSNGLWRFQRLDSIIDPALYPQLHVLTHPEWWTNEFMTPREKIVYALNGRVKSVMKQYDQLLADCNRPNF